MKYQSDNPTDDSDKTVAISKDNNDLKYQSDNLTDDNELKYQSDNPTDDNDDTVAALKDNNGDNTFANLKDYNNLLQYYHMILYGSEIVIQNKKTLNCNNKSLIRI